MRRATPVSCLVLLLLAAAATSRADEARGPLTREELAHTGTAKVQFVHDDWTKVGLDVDGVRVERIELREPKGLRGLVTKHQAPNRGKVLVANTTDHEITPSLAVAVFDDEGHLLAAGNTGIAGRPIKPGDYRQMDVHLGGVYLHLAEGAWVYISLEY